jgi:two-component system osmolarity sensor histidine kinase EnvZ
MRHYTTSLFARTFALLTAVLCTILFTWLAFFHFFERTPRAQQVAWEVASVVNLTRTALLAAQPELRRQLLVDLAREEGVRIVPAEPSDQTESSRPTPFLAQVEPRLQALLGERTALARRVNGEPGFWIRIDISGDDYWIAVDEERIKRQREPDWFGLIAAALAVALTAAAVVSRWLNAPLEKLAAAIERLAAGQTPAALVENGPGEIALLNRRFNHLARQLEALEHDRNLAMAGISHDLRSPLARLRLELELTPLSADARASMVEEIDRLNEIVGQFIEFAREPDQLNVESVAIRGLVDRVQRTFAARGGSCVSEWTIEVAEDLHWSGRPVDLERILANLINNAIRYGADQSGRVRITLGIIRTANGLVLQLRDHGPGVPTGDLARLLKPFETLDHARTAGAAGSGLGLAIVDRLVRRAGGEVRLEQALGGGLGVRITLPDAGSVPRPQ